MPSANPSEVSYDANAAERAWHATASLRKSAKPALTRGIALQDMALFGLHIAKELREPAVRERFLLLPSQLFDHALLDRMAQAAWAVWYANVRRLAATSGETAALVNADTVSRALETKARMMRVAEFMLAGEHEAAVELASIRAGHGYHDLATDLSRLALLYRRHRDTLQHAGTQYRRKDEDAAQACAAALLRELGEDANTDAKAARDDAARALAVLAETYEPIRRYAQALFDDGPARFPSLWTVRHAKAVSKATAGEATPEDTGASSAG